jgi:hypothetical protein
VCVGLSNRKKGKTKVGRQKAHKIEMICTQVKTEMKRKVGEDPGGGREKRKELGNESPLASMFQKQQTVNESQ